MSNDKTLHYALYIEQVQGNSFDSFITLNGKRIGGGMGQLREVLGSAVSRILNSYADGEFYDPFIPEEDVIIYPPDEEPPKYRGGSHSRSQIDRPTVPGGTAE